MTVYASDALRPVAGHLYIPDSMESRGDPKPLAPFPGVQNGLGEEVSVGDWGYDWKFPNLTRDEMDWWCLTLGYPNWTLPAPVNYFRFVYSGGLPAARLWGLDGNMMNFKVAVIYVPTWERYSNARFQDCVVRFRRMVYMDAP